MRCGYLSLDIHGELYNQYRQINGGLVKMMAEPSQWTGSAASRDEHSLYDTGRFD
jgi:hypothetical protein